MTPAREPRVKLHLPPDRSGRLRRSRLIAQLHDAPQHVLLLVAPAGYGKTTLLGQLAAGHARTAYLRLDETDNDPTMLLADLVDAIDQVQPLDPGLRASILAPAEITAFQGPARVSQAITGLERTIHLILDDLHLVTDRTALDWLGWILEHLPPRLRVVLASRREVTLSLGRLIAAEQVRILGPADLALDARETEQFAELAGIVLPPGGAEELLDRTEGWPLATHLLLRARATATDPSPEAHLAAEADLVRYLRWELFDRMDEATRAWVLRSAALMELSGPLCDAALESTGSLRMLRTLEGDNQLLLPLDALRTSYRYHQLYREFLLGELDAQLPGEREAITRRAAAWLTEQGQVVEAARYLQAIGDLDLMARHLERFAFPIYWRGQMATAREWLALFDRDGIRERYLTVAVLGGLAEALLGDLTAATRWLIAAERTVDERPLFDGSAGPDAWLAGLRAMMMSQGPAAFERDAELGPRLLSPASPLYSQARLLQMVDALLQGRPDLAETRGAEAEAVARALGALPGLSLIWAVRGALALARGDGTAAREHVERGLTTLGATSLQDYASTAMLYAVAARIAAADGRREDAVAHLARVNRMRPLCTAAIPWYAVMVRIHAIRAAVALREPTVARTLLGEIGEIQRVRPDLGALNAEVDQLRPVVESLRSGTPGPWTLTAAELRLLAYLPTHLTFREIAQRMFLSPHTIKTQAMSIYGKLEVSSRREAIERAVAAGLLDASVLHQAEDAALIA